MKAALLNSAHRIGEGSPVLEVVTNNADLWGSEILQPSTRAERFDAEKLVGWVATGAKVQALGGNALGGIDFAAMAAQMATGAAAGAAIAGVGAVVGAVVAGVVFLAQYLAQGRPARDWVNAAPGVHEWFTAYGPQGFLDWVRSTRPELLGSNAQELTRALLLWWLERDGVVITDAPGRSHYSGIPDFVYYNLAGGRDALVGLYEPLGIDYPRTRMEAHPAGHSGADGVSEGLGGVWQLSRKVYVPPGPLATGEDTRGDGPESSSGALLGAGALLAALLLAIKKNNRNGNA